MLDILAYVVRFLTFSVVTCSVYSLPNRCCKEISNLIIFSLGIFGDVYFTIEYCTKTPLLLVY